MGSADPHGVGDVGRVKPGRVTALRLGSSVAASGRALGYETTSAVATGAADAVGTRGEGEPRARGKPAAATGTRMLPRRAGRYACTAAGKPAATADAEAAACQMGAAAVAEKAVTEARWLAMGSADPHGVGDDDRVKPGRAPALRLGSQSMATGVELMQRPMPEANVPPDTAPREPPVHLWAGCRQLQRWSR